MEFDFQKSVLVGFLRNQTLQLNALLKAFDCPVSLEPKIDFEDPNWKEFAPYFSVKFPSENQDNE
ncbi:hypothetical protein D3C87_74410 [compost metagenome]